MALATVVDELIVRLRLDATEYKRVDEEVDKRVTESERKLKKQDEARNKRMKQSQMAVKQFGTSLRGLALTIGSVLGIGGGAAGIVGAVLALTNFETNLRRATVSTGLSNREMQAWGSAARRLGADAAAGSQAIAELAKEQKQFALTGNAPTMQALARLGINVGPDSNIVDVIEQAQQVFRGSSEGQRQQMEAGLAASGVSSDLILLIKSEKDVREAFARSFAESATENRAALDRLADAFESVKNAGIGVAAALADFLQPAAESFGNWMSQAGSDLSAFNDRVQAAGGGVDGFMAVLDAEKPALAATLRFLSEAFQKLGEIIDVAAYGFQQMGRAVQMVVDWVDKKFGAIFGGGGGQVKGALSTIGDVISGFWKDTVRDARREGPAPVGTLTGDAGGVKLSRQAQLRVDRGELGPVVQSPGAQGRAGAPGAPGRTGQPGAPGRQGPTGGTATPPPAKPTAQDVMSYLINQGGLTVQQAAAVAANVQSESGLNPAAFNPAGGGQGARGLAQWRGARINAFRERFGKTPDAAPWQQQLDFLLTDPNERRLLNKSLSGPGGAADLGTKFSQVFEAHGNVAEDVRRGQLAQRLAGNFNPATAAGDMGGANGPQININGPVTVQANNPQDFIGGIQRVSGVTNYNAAVR